MCFCSKISSFVALPVSPVRMTGFNESVTAHSSVDGPSVLLILLNLSCFFLIRVIQMGSVHESALL